MKTDNRLHCYGIFVSYAANATQGKLLCKKGRFQAFVAVASHKVRDQRNHVLSGLPEQIQGIFSARATNRIWYIR
jgi:hypothetical protein